MQSLSETEKKRRGTKRRSSMTIKEVEQRLKITRANVRFYEKEGLIFPKRNPLNDYRDYSEEDVKSLSKIIFLREIGIPIADIRSLIFGKMGIHEILRRQKAVLLAEQQKTKDAELLLNRLLAQPETSFEELSLPEIPSDGPERSLRDTLGELWYFWDKLVVWGFFLLQVICTVCVFPMLPEEIPVSWYGGMPTDYKNRIYFFGYLLLSMLVLYGMRNVLYRWIVGALRCFLDEINAAVTVGGIGYSFSLQVFTVLWLRGYQMSQDLFLIGCICFYAILVALAFLVIRHKKLHMSGGSV